MAGMEIVAWFVKRETRHVKRLKPQIIHASRHPWTMRPAQHRPVLAISVRMPSFRFPESSSTFICTYFQQSIPVSQSHFPSHLLHL